MVRVAISLLVLFSIGLGLVGYNGHKPKFQVGDCIIATNDLNKECWEQYPMVIRKIVTVGKKKYQYKHIEIQSDGSQFEFISDYTIIEIDKISEKVECPIPTQLDNYGS